MMCEKTGGWMYLPERGEWVYGDLYRLANGTLIVRVINDIVHNTSFDDPGVPIWAEVLAECEFTDGRMKTIIGKGRQLRKFVITADGVDEIELEGTDT